MHGVRWPASNPKCLHVDFGRETDMEKAIMSTLEEPTVTRTITNDVATREAETTNSFGWSKADAYRNEIDEKAKVCFYLYLGNVIFDDIIKLQQTVRPVREWDLGKQRTEDKDKEKDRRRDRESERSRDRNTRDRDRRDRRRTPEKRSRSLSAGKRYF